MAARTREPDPGWKYATQVEGNKNWVKCNFCGFVSKGGITRQKHHLAWDSPEVGKCSKVPNDVKNFFKESFEKKKQERKDMFNMPHFDDVVDLDDEDEDELQTTSSGVNSKGKRPISSAGSTAPNTKKVKGPLDMLFKPSGLSGKRSGHLVGTPQHNQVQKKLRQDAVQKFARWMYAAGIAFNAVKYDSLGPALEAVALHGVGMKPPSYHEVRVPMLKLELAHTKLILQENETEKKTFGCSLMADGWRDRKGRALINFLVNTPLGSMFLESVDASSYSHTGENMFKLFDAFIIKAGPSEVVQIITDSASNNVFAGKLVEEKYPHIYWTPCAAHCIDLMFEDIFKLPHLKRTLERAIAFNTYIYNRTLLLNMMREFTGHKDMVRPAKTRFATALITLECFKSNKKKLRTMFTSEEWNKTKFSREAGGRQATKTMLMSSFWINVDIAVKIGVPLLRVLRLVDGEKKPAMGYIYEAMDRAKEEIAKAFKNKLNRYEQVFNIIDRRWNCQLHQPLHAAGHYLNPGLYYGNPEVENDTEVLSGLFSCIHKLASSEEEEIQIHSELPIYRNAQGIFANPIAKKMRKTLAPGVWWTQYGAAAPALKKFAVKVLSLTCSSSGCERNWSIFEHLHSKKRNRLEQQKLNDLVYIKYNRALKRRFEMRNTIDPIILDGAHVQDPTEWLAEEDDLVFEGEGLTWSQVEEATGAGEAPYSTRKASGSRKDAEASSSASNTRRRGLVDEEDDYDLGRDEEEENDDAAYKDFVPTSDQDDDDDEPYDDLDDE